MIGFTASRASARVHSPEFRIPSLPLLRRFPALQRIPRASLGEYPTPVERLQVADLAGELWIKRDDLNAAEFGGNKVRSLEFLLGGVTAGDDILTVGGEGSTHVLATAVHAARLGARTSAVRWLHEMNPEALDVAREAARLCARVVTSRNIGLAMGRAYFARARGFTNERARERAGRGVRWIPLGGTSLLGMLGHVNAGLELAEQVAAGSMPRPARVVVPLGSGGTAAGLALAFAVAGLDATVVGARVAPRIASNRWRVLLLARSESEWISRLTGEHLPHVRRHAVEVVHNVYAGAYGRTLAAATESSALLERERGIVLDTTYSSKAFAAALAIARREASPTLFWLTFDGRWLRSRRTFAH